MSPGVEDLWGDEVAVALEQAKARRAHVRRIAEAFGADFWQLPNALPYRGLARCYTRDYAELMASAHNLDAPPGWSARREWNRDCLIIMPLWLQWVLDAWDWRWSLVRVAIRLGLWHVAPGDDYRTGYSPPWLALRHIAWCFVNDRDRYEPDRRAFMALAYRGMTFEGPPRNLTRAQLDKLAGQIKDGSLWREE